MIPDLDAHGEPLDKSYLEAGLPEDLRESIDLLNQNTNPLRTDLYQDNLYADINQAVIAQEISNQCADYLRNKYLDPHYVPLAMR